jgi:hypothetical protein
MLAVSLPSSCSLNLEPVLNTIQHKLWKEGLLCLCVCDLDKNACEVAWGIIYCTYHSDPFLPSLICYCIIIIIIIIIIINSPPLMQTVG